MRLASIKVDEGGNGSKNSRARLRPEHVYYAVETLFDSSTSFIAPVYVIFLLRSGLDYKGVALVDGFYMVSGALLDYPTGGLADRCGRGRITSLASIFFGLGLLSYSLSSTLWQFLFSEFLAAVGAALYSGAFMAWLVDSLREEGREDTLSSVLGNASLLTWLAGVAGAFVGGLLAEYDIRLPFMAGSALCFTASFLAAALTRGRGEVASRAKRSYIGFLSSGARNFFRNRPLLLLTAGSVFITLGVPSFTLTWAPYAESLGADKKLLGLMASIFMAAYGLSGYVGGKLPRIAGYRRGTSAILLAISASFLALRLAEGPLAFLIAAIPLEIGFGMTRPVLAAWVNRYVPSDERATILSLRRTLLLPFTAMGMAAMGILSDMESPRLAYLFGSAAFFLAIFVFLSVPEEG